MNVKGKKVGLFLTEAENIKMPHPNELEPHIEYDKLPKGQYLFNVHVDKINLFKTTKLEDALIYFWCIIYVGKVEYLKDGIAVCYLLERYLIKLCLDCKHMTKKATIQTHYPKIMEMMNESTLEDDFIKQIRTFVP